MCMKDRSMQLQPGSEMLFRTGNKLGHKGFLEVIAKGAAYLYNEHLSGLFNYINSNTWLKHANVNEPLIHRWNMGGVTHK